MTAGRPCSKCARPVAARGLCYFHHQKFITANPDARVTVINERMVLAVLPATVAEIMQATELGPWTVGRVLKRLRAANQSFIGGHEPPHSKGCKWLAVHHPGEGKDVTVSAKRKKAHREAGEAMMQERRIARRKAKKAAPAGWAAALMVGV